MKKNMQWIALVIFGFLLNFSFAAQKAYTQNDLDGFKIEDGWYQFGDTMICNPGDFFSNHASDIGSWTYDSFVLYDSFVGATGYLNHRFRQYHKGYPVEGSYALISSINDRVFSLLYILTDSMDVNDSTNITEEAALDSALQLFDSTIHFAWNDTAWENELKEINEDTNATFYPSGFLTFVPNEVDSSFTLCWKFEIMQITGLVESHYVYINANNGSVFRTSSAFNRCSYTKGHCKTK